MSSFIFHYQDIKRYYSQWKSVFPLSLLFSSNPKIFKRTFSLKISFRPLYCSWMYSCLERLGKVSYFYLGYCGWMVSSHAVNLIHAKCETYLACRIDPAYLDTLDTRVSLPVLCMQKAGDYRQMDTLFKFNQDKISGLKEETFREPLCSTCIYMNICIAQQTGKHSSLERFSDFTVC